MKIIATLVILGLALSASAMPYLTEEEVYGCPENWDPVCAETQFQCFRAPCIQQQKTVSNMCEVKQQGLRYLYDGECQEQKEYPLAQVESVIQDFADFTSYEECVEDYCSIYLSNARKMCIEKYATKRLIPCSRYSKEQEEFLSVVQDFDFEPRCDKTQKCDQRGGKYGDCWAATRFVQDPSWYPSCEKGSDEKFGYCCKASSWKSTYGQEDLAQVESVIQDFEEQQCDESQQCGGRYGDCWASKRFVQDPSWYPKCEIGSNGKTGYCCKASNLVQDFLRTFNEQQCDRAQKCGGKYGKCWSASKYPNCLGKGYEGFGYCCK